MHLHSLFYPKSVAVIGASHELGSVGNELIKNVAESGYKGSVFPVNPKGGTLYGLPVKTSLKEISKPVDLIVVAVPAKIVPFVLEEAGQQHVKAAIVISAGFKEVGNVELERQIAQICEKYQIALVGPNCLGMINPEIKLNASFTSIMPASGNLAFLSQSGAICSSILDYAKSRRLGFSKFISVGNKAMVDEAALLEYLYRDQETKVIMMYVEQLSHIPALMQIAQRITRGRPHKPIIVLKSGSTTAGSQASQSHTGALAGSDAAYDALFAQSGMLRADSISELFDLAECFTRNSILKDKEIAIITNAGGPGVLTTDALIAEGMSMAQVSELTKSRLRRVLPAAASVKNPIDILGDADAERYEKALKIVLHDASVKGLIVILTPQSMTEVEKTARVLARLKKKSRKPIIVNFMGDQAVAEGMEVLHKAGVATTAFPEPGAKGLSALQKFSQWLKPGNTHHFRSQDIDRQAVTELLAQARTDGHKLVHIDTVFKILGAYGLPLIERRVVTSVAEAVKTTKHFDGTVVLKIVSPDIIHKSEAGGVMLDVEPDTIEQNYQRLLRHVKQRQPQARITGVEIMEMVKTQGLEVILGITTDPALGKLVMVGWGGIYTEVLKDVAWGLAPLTHDDAERMVESLTAHQIIQGARGQAKLDKHFLLGVIGRLSQLALDFPQIKELDINPLALMAKGQGGKILDARILLEDV